MTLAVDDLAQLTKWIFDEQLVSRLAWLFVAVVRIGEFQAISVVLLPGSHPLTYAPDQSKSELYISE